MKKVLKIVGITLGIIFLILLIVPFAFKGKITKIAKEQANANVNATIGFSDVSVSLIKSFPDLSVDLRELTVVNKAPFLGDTLAAVNHVYIDVSLSSLLGDVPKINNIKVADVLINVKTNKDSISNYDIIFPSEVKEEEATTEESAPFSLDIHNYSLENINLNYVDEVSNMSARIVNFNHNGSGNLSDNILELETHTNAGAITFMMDNVAYLKDLHLKYDAKVGVDHGGDLKLTFKDNVAHINDLNLAFDGVFTMLEEAYDMDFTFKSEKSAFKSLLSLIPNAYTTDFPKVTTTGALDLHGNVKGQYSEEVIPTFDVVIKTVDASLKYPDLPNPITHINLDAHLGNSTGVMDDTKIEMKNFGLQVDKDVFSAKTIVTTPISNLTVDAAFKGQINLANLKNAYPIPELDFDLTGLVKANVTSAFSMNDIDKENYKNIKTSGKVELHDFALGSDYTPKPLIVNNSDLEFSLDHVDLKDTKLSSGDSDVTFNGGLDNLYKYIFDKGSLKGRLNIASTIFKVADFYEADTTTVAAPEVSQDSIMVSTQFKIPENIEFSGNIDAKTVVYDVYELTNFKGNTTVKDQQINFNKAKANIFKGDVLINGFVNTKPEPTVYDFDMDLKQVDISSAFSTVEMLKKVAPILSAFNGRFDSDFKLNGDLNNDFMPVLSNLTGSAFANLQIDKIDASQNKFLSLAESKLSFVDFEKTDLKDLKTTVTFENSKVNVKPFTITYKGMPLTIEGNHSFDGNMNYNLNFDLPAKYLGNEAQSLLSKLSGAEQTNTTVPLSVKVGGTTTKPTVVPNMKSAISALTSQVINNQKEKIKTEAINKIKELITGNNENSDSKESTTEKAKEAGKKLLKGLFGK